MLKWIIIGAILGVFMAIGTETDILSGTVFGAACMVMVRKWIFRNLWM